MLEPSIRIIYITLKIDRKDFFLFKRTSFRRALFCNFYQERISIDINQDYAVEHKVKLFAI